MVATYPGTKRAFTTHINTTEVIDASHMNDVQDEIMAMQTYIGLNPHVSTAGAGSSLGAWSSATRTYATLSDRLANLEAGDLADTHTQYVRFTGTETIPGTKTFAANSTYFGSGTGGNSAIIYLSSGTTSGEATIQWREGTTSRWALFRVQGGADLALLDMVNSRNQVVFSPGASSTAATTTYNSNLAVNGAISANNNLVVSGTTSLGTTTAGALTLSGALTLAAGTGTAAGASAPGDTAGGGTSTAVARADHRHSREAFASSVTAVDANQANGAGAAGTVARGDHAHGVTTAGPTAMTSFGLATATGTSAALSRADHNHGTPAAPTPASVGAVAKTGDTMSGALQVGSGVGYSVVTPGGASNSGYLAFFSAAGTRQGYIGFTSSTATTDAGAIPYIAAMHNFTGNLTTTGTITENGNRVYSAANPPPALASSGTVTTSTVYGQAANPGAATAYSRGDHVHGTPPLPTPAQVGALALSGGALTGAVTSTSYFQAAQGVGAGFRFPNDAYGGSGDLAFIELRQASTGGEDLALTIYVDNDAADYIDLNASGGVNVSRSTLREQGVRVYSPNNPQPVAAGSATVVTETSFGQGASAGTAGTYSKGDHTHGTPPAQTLASLNAVNRAGDTMTGSLNIQMNGSSGMLGLLDTTGGQTTPNKYLRSQAGQLQVINSAYNAVILTVGDAGQLYSNSTVQGNAGVYDGSQRVYSANNPPPVVYLPAVPIAFYAGGSVTAGLRRPEFIAPVNLTLRAARSRSFAGSGTYDVYVNGVNISGASGGFSTTQALFDFADYNINAGDRVQINVASATSDCTDLSVTIDAAMR